MNVVYATATVSLATAGGYPLLVTQGSHWRADDPLVAAHPGLFSEDPRYGMSYSEPQREEVVETMTANPGERRRARRA